MAKVVAASWGTEFIQFLAALAILHQTDWKNKMISSYSSNRLLSYFANSPDAFHPILPIVLVHFIPFFQSSWCISSDSSKRPSAFHPILLIFLVHFIIFYQSSWCISSYSSNRPGAFHHILPIVLVHLIIFFQLSLCI